MASHGSGGHGYQGSPDRTRVITGALAAPLYQKKRGKEAAPVKRRSESDAEREGTGRERGAGLAYVFSTFFV